MNRREKRIAAREAKEEKRLEKRVAEIAKILEKGKEPVSVAEVETPKIPRGTPVPDGGGIFDLVCTVDKSKEDRLGDWSWGVSRCWHAKYGAAYVDEFLAAYAKVKTWRDILEEKTTGKGESTKKRHISYDVEAICKEARNRLVELNLDDQDEIFRFRKSNLERIYGFRFGAVFSTVWFDPTHQIYPVDD